MENELIDDLREANEALQEARQHAIDFADDEEGLITTAVDAKKSEEQEDFDASDDIVIPNATTEVFRSKNRGLRNRNLSTANKDQWGKKRNSRGGTQSFVYILTMLRVVHRDGSSCRYRDAIHPNPRGGAKENLLFSPFGTLLY